METLDYIMIGEHMRTVNGSLGMIKKAVSAIDWKQLREYDTTGWLNEDIFLDYDLDESTTLVAMIFEDDEMHNLFPDMVPATGVYVYDELFPDEQF